MKILLIDDSMMQQKIARIYLEKGSGFELFCAKNGKEGLEIAYKEMPEIILLDVEMPEMNGEEVLKALKADPMTQGIPVIMCTGAEDFIEAHYEALGAVGYIKKPHGFNTLKAKIVEIFGSEELQKK